MRELPPRVAASRDRLVFSVLDGWPYAKARAKLRAVEFRWAGRQVLLMFVAWVAIMCSPEKGAPAWLLALVWSTGLTSLFIWFWPERQAKARLKRLAQRARRIDERRRAEGRVVIRVH